MLLLEHLRVLAADRVVTDRDERAGVTQAEHACVGTLPEDPVACEVVIQEGDLAEDADLLEDLLHLAAEAAGAQDQDVHVGSDDRIVRVVAEERRAFRNCLLIRMTDDTRIPRSAIGFLTFFVTCFPLPVLSLINQFCHQFLRFRDRPNVCERAQVTAGVCMWFLMVYSLSFKRG